MAERIKTYSIGDVAKMTNVSKKQLRHWEGKYIDQPMRNSCGERHYRRYTEAEVKIIGEIKKLIDQGFTLRSASKMARAKFNRKETDNHA